MCFFILFILLFVFDGYVFMVVCMFVYSWQLSLWYLLYGIYWVVLVFLLIWMLGSDVGWFENWLKLMVIVVCILFFIVYIFKMLVVVVMVVDDFWWFIGWLVIQLGSGVEFSVDCFCFLVQLGLMFGVVFFFSFIYGMVCNFYCYCFFMEKVCIFGLLDVLQGFKIVQILDIYFGSFLYKELVCNVVDLINVQQLDLVFFMGDLVNNKVEEVQFFVDVFDKINVCYGVYLVLGNYDYGDYV